VANKFTKALEAEHIHVEAEVLKWVGLLCGMSTFGWSWLSTSVWRAEAAHLPGVLWSVPMSILILSGMAVSHSILSQLHNHKLGIYQLPVLLW